MTPVDLATIAAAALAALGATVGATRYAYHRLKSRVVVRLITKKGDKDIDRFLDLYERVFDENLRVSTEELIRWVEEEQSPSDLHFYSWRHYLFVCKVGQECGGFLKCIYCSECKLMFIAYYAIDKRIPNARRLATMTMVKSLLKLIRGRIRDCKGVVFELEKEDPSQSKDANDERKARLRLFKEATVRQGFEFYKLGIDYKQPRMTVDEADKEESLELIYIPITKLPNTANTLFKKDVLEVLGFIYKKIYGPTFRHSPDKDKKYSAYIESLIKGYKKSLPSRIKLERL